MAKKIAFLLVLLFVLALASVTAFAAGTDTTTPEAGFTQDKADSQISIKDLEDKYGDIFFSADSKSDKAIIEVSYQRKSSTKYPLRHYFNGKVIDSVTGSAAYENPVVMLMYIKKDGKYIPLCDVNTDKNYIERPFYLSSTVDLAYIGSNKVNEVRIIAFRKKDIDKLSLNENLQIIDFLITVRYWDYGEITFKDLTTL